MGFSVEVTLENSRPNEVEVKIPKGMLFEAQDVRQRIQNLVCAKEYTFRLVPYGTVTVVLEAYCANRSFSPPENTPMNVTPFVVRADLVSQDATWQYFSHS